MTELPGNKGIGVLGDKTIDIYKDPFNFVYRSIDTFKSRVFLTRFFMKPTVVLASNDATYELLNEKYQEFDSGYMDVMQNFYGENNILFMNDKNAEIARAILKPFLCQHTVNSNISKVQALITEWTDLLPTREPVPVHACFKQLALHLCIVLFLGIESPEVIQEIITLTSILGMISLPMNAKVPSFMPTSDKKVMAAKEKLTAIIEEHVSFESVSIDEESKKLILQHLFMSVTLLIPKAIASLLTSFVITSKLWIKDYTNKQGNLLMEELDNLLLEIRRCWPPFIGGRRIASKKCLSFKELTATSVEALIRELLNELVRGPIYAFTWQISSTFKECHLYGYQIPSGYAVLYLNFAVHRDPDIFPNPDVFWPERWKTCNISHGNRIFSFGGGPRNCIAASLMEDVIKLICCQLMEKCYWEPIKFTNADLRWFPVTRPKQDPCIQFISKHPK